MRMPTAAMGMAGMGMRMTPMAAGATGMGTDVMRADVVRAVSSAVAGTPFRVMAGEGRPSTTFLPRISTIVDGRPSPAMTRGAARAMKHGAARLTTRPALRALPRSLRP